MKWVEKAKEMDKDTIKVLKITAYFLKTYFDYPEDKSEDLILEFITKFEAKIDEDFIHQMSSYRLSALIHFTIGEHISFEKANQIIIEKGYHIPPPEALEYFRENYFNQYLDNPLRKFPFE